MSRLEELIKELCPDGVEYKTIGELCSIVTKQTGFDYTNHIKDSLLRTPEDDAIPYIQTKFFSGKHFNYETDYYVPKKTYEQFPKITLEKECILFSIVGASIGNVGLFRGERKCFLGGAICVAKPLPQFNTDYVYYCVESCHVQKQIISKIKGAGQATITVEDIRHFSIPFPPLPIQQEIVRILDSFTELTAELTAKLTAELEARKKQYQYYRDYIITAHNYPHVRLGELCEIGDGLHGTPSYDEQGEYYFVNGNNLSGGKIVVDNKTKKVNSRESNKYKKNFCDTIFMSINGTIGNMALYNGEKIILGKSAAYFTVQSQHLNKFYLYYYLQTQYAHQYYEANLTGSTIKNLGLKALRDFQIPLPSLNTQTQLVEIISHFHELSANIATGLPAEIAARQKQYEYYRDKLLTFKAYCA